MAFEQYANLCSTNLTAGYTAGAGSIAVTSTASPWPASPQFHIYIADPTTGVVKVILKVTAVTDATHWAVTAEGTDANASSGDVVKLSLTAGAMDQIRVDVSQLGAYASKTSQKAGNIYFPNDALVLSRDNGASFDSFGPIWPLGDPNAQTWTQQSFGSCSSDTTHGGISILNTASEAAFNVHALTFPTPATPYHIEFTYFQYKANSTNFMTGACFSDGTKYEIFDPAFQQAYGNSVVFYLTNNTTFSSTPVNTNNANNLGFPPTLFWVRIGDDGTNKTWDVSVDGYRWSQVGSEARATNFVATKAGIYVDCGPSYIRLISCKITA
jgi:hypothetical protein